MIRCSIKVFSRSGKSRNLRDLGLQHLQLNDHVPEQLSAGRVGESAVVGQLVDFPNVVKKRSGQQKVAIDRGDSSGTSDHRNGTTKPHDPEAHRCMHDASSSLRELSGRLRQFPDRP